MKNAYSWAKRSEKKNGRYRNLEKGDGFQEGSIRRESGGITWYSKKKKRRWPVEVGGITAVRRQSLEGEHRKA